MTVRIIDKPQVAIEPASRASIKARPPEPGASHRFEFWSGASGQRYVHTIYSLIECPELPRANYVLVHRDAAGRCRVLRIGRLAHKAESLNLAEIRHTGAKLGANEVHVHLLGRSDQQRRQIALDITAAQVSELPRTGASE
jgi:hypothetical protein